ncbi:MAG TPA: membrane protein insertase YidC [Nevskiaceae bacterium]|nr:membrane protein insertase YidC [Nevskiaceae bacterium]
MENRRFILIALLGVVLFFIYQAWQTDYPPPAVAPAAAAASLPGESAPSPAPTSSSTTTLPAEASATDVPATPIQVHTDLVNAEISPNGGDLDRVELLGYPEFKDQPENLALLDNRNGRWFVLQSGLASSQDALVTPQSLFMSAASSYQLAPGTDTLDVTLEHAAPAGYRVRKTYRFHRGSYEIELIQTLVNGSDAEISASPWVRFARLPYTVGYQPKFSKTFAGEGLYVQKEGSTSYRFDKISFDDLSKKPTTVQQTGGWVAMLQHYFVAAIIPPADEKLTLTAKPGKDRGFVGQYVGAFATAPVHGEHSYSTKLYIGPELQDRVADIAPGFELTLDYGILTPIAKPLFWVLQLYHRLLGNWGFAIILLTLTVKLAMLKLSEAQYRSMAKMKKFGPRIQELKERYADDRERQQKAMMDLYKKEGFNPLAGCWPLLLQMPVFFALLWVLQQSVELRMVPFALWVKDLSAPDPYYVLPVLYGAAMWAQQKISGQNAAMDPMQQKMMNVMPIALTAFFTFWPSGLVLYWLASTLIGIAQQAYITRKYAEEGAARA